MTETTVVSVVELLVQALGQVEADIAAREAAEIEQVVQNRQEDQDLARAIQGRLPDWVVRLEIDHSSHNLHGRDRVEARPYFVWVAHELGGQQVAKTLRDVPGVLQFYSTLNQSFSYIAAGDDPIVPLASATPLLRDALANREQRMAPMREWKERVQRAAESALRTDD